MFAHAPSLALSVASLGLALGVLELAARLTEDTWPPIPVLYTEHDPLLGWRHRPGARATSPEGAYAINSLGLRDVERAYVTPGGVQRILILGDSFAEGYSVPFEDSVSQVLERQLCGEGVPTEVINGGVVAYSTDQEYLFYRTEMFRYDARIVLLLFYYNDILANVQTVVDLAPKPRLSCDDGAFRVLNEPVPPPGAHVARAHHAPPDPWGSAALEWLRRRASSRPSLFNRLAGVGLWKRSDAAPVPDELSVFESPPPRPAREAWRCTTRLLEALSDQTKAHAAQLVLVYVPSKMEVTQRDWGLTQLEYKLDPGRWDRRRVARELIETGARLGVPTLDLTVPLQEADSAIFGGPYHSHGGHWNALGHRVAAASLRRFLREGGLLAKKVGAN